MDKKCFDDLTNKEQGKQQKKKTQEQGTNHEKSTSCEHPDRRAETELEEKQNKDGIIAANML